MSQAKQSILCSECLCFWKWELCVFSALRRGLATSCGWMKQGLAFIRVCTWARDTSSHRRVSVRINLITSISFQCGCVSVCTFAWVLAVVNLLSLRVESIHPVKMAGFAQEKETCCHKHISLCLNTDDTEVPITQPVAECMQRAGCVLTWVCCICIKKKFSFMFPIFHLFTNKI